MKDFKKRVFSIIQIGSSTDIKSRIFDIFIAVMIIANIAATVLLTFQELENDFALFYRIELLTIVVFIIEYLLRLWTSDLLYPEKGKLKAGFSFALSFYGIVDLLTIISFFMPLFSNGIVTLRMVRVIRIFRMFQISNNFDAFNVIAEVLKKKRKQLVSSVFVIFMLMLFSSLCIYSFENTVQPTAFQNAFSGLWWAMSTVLTVGYGDIYPITIGGRIAAMVISLLGVCVVAIPTGILSAGFVDYYAAGGAELDLNEDILKKLEEQAKKQGISAKEYMEYLIVDDLNDAGNGKKYDKGRKRSKE